MFRKLLSFDEAKQLLEQSFSAKPVGIEQASISNAHNRVLAQDIVSPMNIPPFSRSTVDGYAVKAADTFGASEDNDVSLRFCGHVAIGEAPAVTVTKGSAAEIVTGAPLPDGADAVVMVEYTSQEEDNVFVRRPVAKNANIMAAGSDIRKGETVLKKGRVLGSREVGALAAIGLTEVAVYKRPRVAVLSTGGEVVEPGEVLPAGKIYDINAHTLSAAVVKCGGEAVNLRIVPDKKDKLTAALRHAMASEDAELPSGGVSVAPKDFSPQVVDSLRNTGVIISGVAVKPGKPITVALVEGKPVFSLPGNPTSSLFMFSVFVRPVLVKLAGRTEEEIPKVRAVATQKMFPARGRRTFTMVNLTYNEAGTLLVSPFPTGLSGAITTMTKADGFVEISEKQQFVDAGTEIDVYLFKKLKKQ